MSPRRGLLLTPGMGVGPELTLRVLAEDGADDVIVIGRAAALEAARAAAPALRLLPMSLAEALSHAGPGAPLVEIADAPGLPAEAGAVKVAAEALLGGLRGALVTGPIHKKRLSEGVFTHQGHTDFLAALCGVDDVVMAFTGGDLRVALVTTHLPLRAVSAAVTAARVQAVCRVAITALRRDLGLDPQRVLVCGLNPHAGEEGLLGDEELLTIGPAVRALQAEGWPVLGPMSAETAFMEAQRGRGELIVAMYHDQGLAPLKAVDFGRSVNWTLGLPIIRTSVDHGTADALMGTGRAEPHSLRAALRLARQIVAQRWPQPPEPAASA